MIRLKLYVVALICVVALVITLGIGITLWLGFQTEPSEERAQRFSEQLDIQTSDGMLPIALLIGPIGLARDVMRATIEGLPTSVTLVFSPYTSDLERWLSRNRNLQRETLIELPVQSTTYPINDPGPMALSPTLTENENLSFAQPILKLKNMINGVVMTVPGGGIANFEKNSPIIEKVVDYFADESVTIIDGTRLITMTTDSTRITWSYWWGPSTQDFELFLNSLSREIHRNRGGIVHINVSPQILPTLAAWIDNLPQQNITILPISEFIEYTPPTG
ncbi:MAG: divergent polysaccharide deacetylase family protein [Pseudomonadota bacterium]